MFVIGERLNGMFMDVRKGIQTKDKSIIHKVALDQVKAGANALDINVGPASDKPLETMVWLVETVQEVTDITLSIDSPKFDVMKAALEVCKNPALMNSTKGEEAKLDKYFELASKHNASIIGLCINEKGIPKTIDGRVEVAALIAAKAMEHGIDMDRLYIDPIVMPTNVAQDQAVIVLEAIKQFGLLSSPPPHIVVGLSNLGQGAKERELLTRTWIVMAILNGLDAAIMDAADEEMTKAFITAELLMGKAIYSDSYIKAYHASHDHVQK
ncbi:MAG: methyltetrahydrofolate--corrinoid methyltransferase [Candidatus Abyssobacteria bacterium SURF_17]|jgi:5-methyltetrahydrofolate corrinoid/iron sulfur protein methyltransferase|uniref:Methyltetrahydrofolate--corrinoid methyltransferase n=1 Tax=Candidatus Abyssobacteria bacterium SURF_17 TaxID=2093361 RepID=A0A419EUT6_9BACT|nr:MAG: methyltetrahydrofolate--corrinoid methyltransferase [Candidatus Abyssubacteria bacterium SURF_17]